jgi:translation initiation factor IF-1
MITRNWDRQTIEREVACVIGGKRERVFLYNLSGGGGMIEMASHSLSEGDEVVLELGEFAQVRGRIIWEMASCAGVRFEEPVHEAIVVHLGFTPQPISFEDELPRDRFGRALPSMPAMTRPRFA